MPKKHKAQNTRDKTRTGGSKELWVAQRTNLKGESGERAWDHRHVGAPSGSRFLELADIALGLKKPYPKKKFTRNSDQG